MVRYTSVDAILTGIGTNLGMPIEGIILFFTAVGCLLFFAKSVRLGAVMMFLLFSIDFIAFIMWGWDITIAMSAMLISFAILCIVLLISKEQGGYVA